VSAFDGHIRASLVPDQVDMAPGKREKDVQARFSYQLGSTSFSFRTLNSPGAVFPYGYPYNATHDGRSVSRGISLPVRYTVQVRKHYIWIERGDGLLCNTGLRSELYSFLCAQLFEIPLVERILYLTYQQESKEIAFVPITMSEYRSTRESARNTIEALGLLTHVRSVPSVRAYGDDFFLEALPDNPGAIKCVLCDRYKHRSAYSKSQTKKSSSRRTCKECLAAGYT
jgi:hypothetical protein